jgi:hypothetical protein
MSMLLEDPAIGALTWCWRTPWRGCQGSGRMLSRGMRIRQIGLTSGEIMSARGYRDGGKDWCRLLLGLVLF